MWPPTPNGGCATSTLIRRAAGMGRAASEPGSRSLRAPVRALRRARDRRRPRRPRRGARRGARRRARASLCDENPCWAAASSARARRSTAWPPTRGSTRRRASSRAHAGRHAAVAHDGLRLLRRQSGRRCRARRRSSAGAAAATTPRQRLWKVRAQGGGARDRRASSARIAYANNDLPGTMLAGAARTYVEALRGAARDARRGVHQQRQRLRDGARAAARRRRGRGDRRCARERGARRRAADRGARRGPADHWPGRAIVGAHGALRVAAVDVAPLRRRRDAAHRLRSRLRVRRLESRGPSLSRRRAASCATTTRSRPSFPTVAVRRSRPAGAANGTFDLAAALAEGHAAGLAAARAARAAAPMRRSRPPRAVAVASGAPQPLWSVRATRQGAKRFVDLQNDVTVDDIALAAREGYQSVEHLKRYTTLGMGTDQGKTSNIVGLALLARAARRADRRGRHDDVPPAVHAGHARRVSRHRRGHARRADALLGDARLARRARRALRQRGPVEAAALVSARRANPRTTRRTAKRATSASTSASSTCPRSARSSCRAATSRSS